MDGMKELYIYWNGKLKHTHEEKRRRYRVVKIYVCYTISMNQSIIIKKSFFFSTLLGLKTSEEKDRNTADERK
jgi:hypothetical protein